MSLGPSPEAYEEFKRLERALQLTKSELSNMEQSRRKAKGETRANLWKQVDKLK